MSNEMNEKDKKLFRRSINEFDRMNNHYSITNNYELTNQQTILSIPTTTITNKNRKRLISDECFIEESNKRIRCESSKKIQSENQPPRATIKRRSLFLYHPKYDWNHFNIDNHHSPSSIITPIPTTSSSLSSSTYSLLPSIPISQTFNPQYSSSLCDMHTNHHYSHMFINESSMKTNLQIYPTQTDVSSPLRTTNFVLDSKQHNMNATIMRTGNISPAHSDTSIESTSTCSSDEIHFHSNFSTLHSQPSRSFRERENYEQLLDLAEKLADPDRLEKIDIEQFFSYRYKTIITTNDIFSSKQTACVICMSPFKNGQRIRVLPCQHEYHNKCIARWFTMNSSCPICRRDSFHSNC